MSIGIGFKTPHVPSKLAQANSQKNPGIAAGVLHCWITA
jgi:hypothetical protein